MKSADVKTRFWLFVDECRIDMCWQWLGTKNQKGYGQLMIDGACKKAHRVAYELRVSQIPEGLQIDHLCRNRSCVNPSHMEVVTNKENVLRGEGITAQNARKKVCQNGHPLNYRRPNGNRRCQICDREYQQKRQALKSIKED